MDIRRLTGAQSFLLRQGYSAALAATDGDEYRGDVVKAAWKNVAFVAQPPVRDVLFELTSRR